MPLCLLSKRETCAASSFIVTISETKLAFLLCSLWLGDMHPSSALRWTQHGNYVHRTLGLYLLPRTLPDRTYADVRWDEKPEEQLLPCSLSFLRKLANEECEKLGSNFIFKDSRGWDCKNKRKKLPKHGDTVSLHLASKCHSPAQNNHQKVPQ